MVQVSVHVQNMSMAQQVSIRPSSANGFLSGSESPPLDFLDFQREEFNDPALLKFLTRTKFAPSPFLFGSNEKPKRSVFKGCLDIFKMNKAGCQIFPDYVVKSHLMLFWKRRHVFF